MNNYCRNCGEILTNSSICEKCGTRILTDRVGELNRTLEKRYIKIFFAIFILFIMNYVIMFFLPKVYALLSGLPLSSGPLFLTGFIIVAKKELKYSKFFNIAFLIILPLIILFILFILYILFGFISFWYKF